MDLISTLEPEQFRMRFTLFAVEGLTKQEIADKLNLPLGTIQSSISRARQKLIPLANERYPKKDRYPL